MSDPIKIALVDDESLFVEGLDLLFSNEKNVNVVTVADSGIVFLDYLSNAPMECFPDIGLIDIQMKPMDGFELVEQLRIHYPNLKIIVLSSHYKTNFLGLMVKLGVSAFISKNAGKTLLMEAIQCVYTTGVYFTQKDHQLLISYMNGKSQKPTFDFSEDLSDREIDVLKLICLEQTNQEIADKLFISKRTVESHRQRILDKTGAKNTVGLVIYAIANEIHPLPKFSYTV
jgi:DNA-binding NarL/FixJ family response regulator